ncbi:MAG: PPOX class F420-dependent oxidoreductase [Beutenbergiaceae bacterium]
MALMIPEALAWAEQHRHAVVITIKADGSPQSSDVVYRVVDGELEVSVTADRAKTANIRRDPRIVVHVSRPDTWSYVSFSGSATLSDVATEPTDPVVDGLVAYYQAVAGKPHDDWDEYRAAMVAQRRLLLRLAPQRAVGHI